MEKEISHNLEGLADSSDNPTHEQETIKHESIAPSPKESEFDRQAAISHIREVIRTDRSQAAYEKFFGEEITKPKGMILDLASGDSNFADSVNQDGDLKVVRCDFGYSKTPPENARGAVAGLAQELPFQDGSFKKVISSCLFEHIRAEDAPNALTEMLRVTQDGGEIMVFPAYRPLHGEYPFAKRAILAKSLIDRLKLTLAKQPTLIIKKDTTLTEEEWDKAVEDLAQSVRLSPMLEKLERLYMKIRLRVKGDVRMHR